MDVSGQLHVPATLHLGMQPPPPVPTEFEAETAQEPLRGIKAGSLSSDTHCLVTAVLLVFLTICMSLFAFTYNDTTD